MSFQTLCLGGKKESRMVVVKLAKISYNDF